MQSETFTLIGMRLGAFDWLFPGILAVLALISWFFARRAFVVAAIGAGITSLVVALVAMPISEIVGLIMMMLSGSTIVWTHPRLSPTQRVAIVPALMPMMVACLLPLVTSMLVSYSEICLTDDAAVYSARYKTTTVQRNSVDMTYESSNLMGFGQGPFWDFQDRQGHSAGITGTFVYLTNRNEIIGGDEVARRIAAWSGVRPRPIFHGESHAWVDKYKARP